MSVNKKNINVAVWGLGKHALKNILPALIECESIVLAGVYSRNSDIVEKSRQQFACNSWDSEEALLSDEDIDVIYLATPIGLHFDQGLKILNANKHFWCEKPLVYNSQKANQLINIARKNHLSICEGFMYQYHPQFKWLKEFIKEGELGEIKSIRCRFGLPSLDEPGFRYSAGLGGSALLDIGCYPLSLILDLFPDDEPIIKNFKTKISEKYNIDMEGSALLSILDNTDVFLEWGMGYGYLNEVDIWGAAGSIYTDKIFSKPADYAPSFVLSGVNGQKRTISCEPTNHFVPMFKYFRRAARDDTIAELEYRRVLRKAHYLDELYNSVKADRFQ